MSGRPDLLQDLDRPLVSGNGWHAVKKRTAQKSNRSKRKHALPALSFLLSFPSFLFNLSLFCPSVSLSFLFFCLLSLSTTPHCMPERLKQAISIVLIRKSNPVLISLSSTNPLGYTDILLLCLFRILQVSNLVAYSEELINRNGMQKLRYLLSGDSVKWITERKNTLETLLVAYAFFFFFSFFFFFFCFVFQKGMSIRSHCSPILLTNRDFSRNSAELKGYLRMYTSDANLSFFLTGFYFK